MSGELKSPVEEALENQPFGALQLRVVLLCALVQAFDGFDLGTIGMAAPSLSKAWGVAPPQFTIAFVMSSVGILVGALLSGPLGDRFGRKPLLVISVALHRPVLGAVGLRLVGAIDHRDAVPDRHRHRRRHARDRRADRRLQPDQPARHALDADVLRQHDRRLPRRPAGRADPPDLRLAEHLPLRRHSAAGADPVPAALSAGIAALPDRAPRRRTGDAAILRKLNVSAQAAASKLVDVAKGNPVQQLFTGGLALTTMLVWVVFFANLLNMYLFSYWMPTVLNLSGLKPEVAVFYASMFQLGGILSCLLLGPMIDRFGAPKVLACSFASGVIFILAVGSRQSAGALHRDSRSSARVRR